MSFLLFDYPAKDYSLKMEIPTTIVPEFAAVRLILPLCSESLSVYEDVFVREMYPN